MFETKIKTSKNNRTLTKIIGSFRSSNYLIQLVHGVLLTLAFHPFDIFLVIPISFSGFLWCLEKECLAGIKRNQQEFFNLGFNHAFVFFIGHFVTSLYWLINPILLEIKTYWFLIPLIILIIPALLASFYAIASAIICSKYIFKKTQELQINNGWTKISIAVLFAIGFFIAELLRAYLLLPFPWNLLGYASGYSLSLMQLASVTGVYGLSILLYLVGTIPYTKHSGAISSITIIVVILTISGGERLNNAPQVHKQKIVSLNVIQPNTQHHYHQYSKKLQAQNKTKSIVESIALRYKKINNQNNINLFILPESSIPFPVGKTEEIILKEWMSRYQSNSFLIAGVDRYDTSNSSYYNSMVVLDNSGFIVDSYDKIILAPFGEYIPGYNILKPIVGESYGFTSGIRDTKIKFYSNSMRGITVSLNIMPMICFESIFTGKKTNDVDLIVNITNDSWLGNSIGPYQHLAMTRMRAIEYGLPLVRSAKTGISAVFNSYGRIIQKIDLNKEEVIVVDMPEDKVETIYMKILNFFRS